MIVLETGLGDSSLAWSLVQPKLATTTRVCSYDRSGTAWSHDAGPQHGLSKAADDRNRLLRISGEPPPYLLVGQSWGGWLITGSARRHLELVAGIVLVDSSGGFDPPNNRKNAGTSRRWSDPARQTMWSAAPFIEFSRPGPTRTLHNGSPVRIDVRMRQTGQRLDRPHPRGPWLR